MPIPLLLVTAAAIALGACVAAFGAMRKLRAARCDRERFFDAAPACLRLDSGARCTGANARAAEQLGTRASDLVGRELGAIVTGSGAAGAIEAIRLAVASRREWSAGGAQPESHVLSHAALEPWQGGFLLWLRQPGELSRSEGGGIAGALAEERRRAEAEMADLRHDLVQPLAAIHNYAELMRRTREAPEQEYASRIIQIAAQMVARIRNGNDGPRAG